MERKNDKNDNSNIVNEILDEMNLSEQKKNNPVQVEKQNENNTLQEMIKERENLPSVSENQHYLNRLDPNINMKLNDNLTPEVIQEDSSEINIPLIEDSTISLKEKIIEVVTEPIIIIILTFIIFSPFLTQILGKNLPKFFSSTTTSLFKYGGLLVRCMLVGILFFCSKLLIK